jgi:hypothetical protein
LLIIGGDGTISEVVNGMFARRNKETLPIGIIPNGTSNDFSKSLGIKNFDQSLDYILSREILPVDTVRVLLDTDTTSGLPEGPERLQKCRYMMAGSLLSMPAKIASSAKSTGLCSFSNSLVSFYKGITCSFETENYDIQVDKLHIGSQSGTETVNTGLLVVSNGKYINGGAMFNPYSVINDGLIDITWVHDPAYSGYWGLSGIMKKASAYGGTHSFDGTCSFLRGKSIKLEFKGRTNGTAADEKKQTVIIDNDDVHYENSIRFESGEGYQGFKVEVLIDTDTYFTEQNAFVLGHNQMINPKEFKEGQLQRIVTKLQSYKDHPDTLQAQIEVYFKEFDADKSGALDREELKNFLIAFFKQYKIRIPLTEEFVDTTFDDIDANGDGFVDMPELKDYLDDFLKILLALFNEALLAHPEKMVNVAAYSI